ncbi:hypothetical protein [Treponema sp. OMZ 857]|uniref:hypothetical protein n=1 Tax=Treponema sp. OMZ 857 TaxID=1643513 RepID=UPI0020A4E577|nr:hypothetical protein [Treponema sp. OMZ 857]
MLDLSRNAVAHIDMLKQFIREMAFMGHSWFMLYMEDVYEVEGAPYFGALRGRYSIKIYRKLTAMPRFSAYSWYRVFRPLLTWISILCGKP